MCQLKKIHTDRIFVLQHKYVNVIIYKKEFILQKPSPFPNHKKTYILHIDWVAWVSIIKYYIITQMFVPNFVNHVNFAWTMPWPLSVWIERMSPKCLRLPQFYRDTQVLRWGEIKNWHVKILVFRAVSKNSLILW